MSTRVLRAGLDELGDVAALFDAYRQFYGQEADAEGARRFLAARIERGDSVILLARRGGAAVGFTQLYPSYSSVAMRPIWILNDLFVGESARRTGVARKLLEHAIQFALEAGAARLVLATGRGNRAAQRLYESVRWLRDVEYVYYKYPL